MRPWKRGNRSCLNAMVMRRERLPPERAARTQQRSLNGGKARKKCRPSAEHSSRFWRDRQSLVVIMAYLIQRDQTVTTSICMNFRMNHCLYNGFILLQLLGHVNGGIGLQVKFPVGGGEVLRNSRQSNRLAPVQWQNGYRICRYWKKISYGNG